MAEEAVEIARGLGDDYVLGDALSELSWSTYLAGDLPAALAMIEEAVALARAAGILTCLRPLSATARRLTAASASWQQPQPTSRRYSRWRERPETTM
jgi:hypothetical protein